MTDEISLDKKYRTRDGREVKLYATDGGDNYPVHGATKNAEGNWIAWTWAITGRSFMCEENANDLIEIKEQRKLVGYVNVYPGDKLGYVFNDRASADGYRGPDRIARVRVEIEYEEGQFDD